MHLARTTQTAITMTIPRPVDRPPGPAPTAIPRRPKRRRTQAVASEASRDNPDQDTGEGPSKMKRKNPRSIPATAKRILEEWREAHLDVGVPAGEEMESLRRKTALNGESIRDWFLEKSGVVHHSVSYQPAFETAWDEGRFNLADIDVENASRVEAVEDSREVEEILCSFRERNWGGEEWTPSNEQLEELSSKTGWSITKVRDWFTRHLLPTAALTELMSWHASHLAFPYLFPDEKAHFCATLEISLERIHEWLFRAAGDRFIPTHPLPPPLPTSSASILRDWIEDHISFPYPSIDVKEDLCAQANIDIEDLEAWFAWARRVAPLPPAQPPPAPPPVQQHSLDQSPQPSDSMEETNPVASTSFLNDQSDFVPPSGPTFPLAAENGFSLDGNGGGAGKRETVGAGGGEEPRLLGEVHRKPYPAEVIQVLSSWVEMNGAYPLKESKKQLSQMTQLSLRQVDAWFCHLRRSLKSRGVLSIKGQPVNVQVLRSGDGDAVVGETEEGEGSGVSGEKDAAGEMQLPAMPVMQTRGSHFSEAILNELEATAVRTLKPTPQEVAELVQKTGLTKLQVQSWFNGARKRSGSGPYVPAALNRWGTGRDKPCKPQGKQTRRKLPMSADAQRSLEEWVRDHGFASPSERESLALRIGVSAGQVRQWFGQAKSSFVQAEDGKWIRRPLELHPLELEVMQQQEGRMQPASTAQEADQMDQSSTETGPGLQFQEQDGQPDIPVDVAVEVSQSTITRALQNASAIEGSGEDDIPVALPSDEPNARPLDTHVRPEEETFYLQEGLDIPVKTEEVFGSLNANLSPQRSGEMIVIDPSPSGTATPSAPRADVQQRGLTFRPLNGNGDSSMMQ
ncbi:hypothetical protein BT69DRAFT_1319714 [Atractiella rhizophila]|nr:hypothetical protein BT69DRAFT_1319714 [Atractiella rhizophila]